MTVHIAGLTIDGAQKPPRSLSGVLTELAEGESERITLDEIAIALADRSYGALLILFAAPNLVPLPPGSSTVFGIPLILIAVQLLLGRPRVWLPRQLRVRSMDRARFGRAARRLEPKLAWLERLVRPRFWPVPRVLTERLVGLLALTMALAIALPIPFGNWLPALAIVALSLGLTERDGLWLGAGTVLTVVSLAVVAVVIATFGLAIDGLF